MRMSTSQSRAEALGVRSGLRSLLTVGRADQAPVIIRRHVGSPATDRDVRVEDMRAFRHDVPNADELVARR